MRNLVSIFVLLAVCWQTNAAVLPPEKLLPKDTIALCTIPDGAKSWASFTNSSYGRLWNDPAMKPFKDKFLARMQSDVAGPIEKQLGIKLSDYQDVIRGQFTLAVVQNVPKSDSPFSLLLLIDAKDQAPRLKTMLAETRKKWTDAGKPLKTEQVRGVEFTTYVTSNLELSNALSKVFPDRKAERGDAQSKDDKIEIVVGQSDSLLIVSDSVKTVDKVLARQTGGLIPALEEDAAFQADYAARLRGAPGYAWVNARMLLTPIFSQEDTDIDPQDPLAMSPKKIFGAMGISEIKTLALVWRDLPEGLMTQLYIGIPDANRRGLFKIAVPDRLDGNPPPFVPADAVKYVRWRLDLNKSWSAMESMMGDVSSGFNNGIALLMDVAGKDKDPNYNFKAELLGSFGNDIISYQKAPRGNNVVEMASPPSIYLIGSPKPDRLALAVKVALESFAQGATVKETEFLGRKLYAASVGEGPRGPALNFAASGSYVAFSTDLAMVEEYLRSSESKAKPLSSVSGLNDAAQKVGGMNTGLFGYSNQSQEMRVVFDLLRKNAINVSELIKGPTLSGRGTGGLKEINEWVDGSLLPPFDAVSKYFNYTVYAGDINADGLTISLFAPNPPPQADQPKAEEAKK